MLSLTQSTSRLSSVRLIFICTILDEDQTGSFLLILRPNFTRTELGKIWPNCNFYLGGPPFCSHENLRHQLIRTAFL